MKSYLFILLWLSAFACSSGNVNMQSNDNESSSDRGELTFRYGSIEDDRFQSQSFEGWYGAIINVSGEILWGKIENGFFSIVTPMADENFYSFALFDQNQQFVAQAKLDNTTTSFRFIPEEPHSFYARYSNSELVLKTAGIEWREGESTNDRDKDGLIDILDLDDDGDGILDTFDPDVGNNGFKDVDDMETKQDYQFVSKLRSCFVEYVQSKDIHGRISSKLRFIARMYEEIGASRMTVETGDTLLALEAISPLTFYGEEEIESTATLKQSVARFTLIDSELPHRSFLFIVDDADIVINDIQFQFDKVSKQLSLQSHPFRDKNFTWVLEYVVDGDPKKQVSKRFTQDNHSINVFEITGGLHVAKMTVVIDTQIIEWNDSSRNEYRIQIL